MFISQPDSLYSEFWLLFDGAKSNWPVLAMREQSWDLYDKEQELFIYPSILGSSKRLQTLGKLLAAGFYA
jgi:hypothetical protein